MDSPASETPTFSLSSASGHHTRTQRVGVGFGLGRRATGRGRPRGSAFRPCARRGGPCRCRSRKAACQGRSRAPRAITSEGGPAGARTPAPVAPTTGVAGGAEVNPPSNGAMGAGGPGGMRHDGKCCCGYCRSCGRYGCVRAVGLLPRMSDWE